MNAASSGVERNFAIGERTSPSEPYTRYASPFAPHSFANVLELGELAAGQLTRHDQVADDGRTGEDAELGSAGHLGRVLDLEPEAEVGLV